MADTALEQEIVPAAGEQPGDLGSIEGHYFEGRQALYLAMKEADRGNQPNATTWYTKAQDQFASIPLDHPDYAIAQNFAANAWAYIQSLSVQPQHDLQIQTAAAEGNYQRSQALTPDQEALLVRDNLQTKAAMESPNPYLSYGFSTFSNDAGPVVDAVAAGGKALGDAATSVLGSFKWPLIVGGIFVVLLVGGVVVWKVLL